MGTSIVFKTFDNCSTTADLSKRWAVAKEDARYEFGNDPYNGSISTVHDLYVAPVRYKDLKEANEAAGRYDVSKREARAFGYGDPTKSFPTTDAERKLTTTLAGLDKELDNFEFDVLKRFVAGKSASRKCGGCDSVISKKSRERLAKRNPRDRNMGVLDLRAAIHELTACPCCGHELLLTDTDKKRRESLQKRAEELRKKVETAKAASFAKNPCGYVVVAGCSS